VVLVEVMGDQEDLVEALVDREDLVASVVQEALVVPDLEAVTEVAMEVVALADHMDIIKTTSKGHSSSSFFNYPMMNIEEMY